MTDQWQTRQLPEDYGSGQRLYDMATFAKRSTAPVAWCAAVGCAGLAAVLLHSAVFLAAAPLIYWLLMRPLNQAVKRGAGEWKKDREAWHQKHFGEPSPW